jgi:hypothetical protein
MSVRLIEGDCLAAMAREEEYQRDICRRLGLEFLDAVTHASG